MLRNSISRYLTAVILPLIFFSQLSTAQENRGAGSRISSADTIEYIPSWYRGALDFNLMIAASKGFPGEIDRLTAIGANINSHNEYGSTPLIIAVDYNHTETVKAILNHSPSLDDFTSDSETALLLAVKKNYTAIAEMLVRAGAQIDLADYKGAASLHYASLYNYPEMTDMLLYYNAQVNSKTDDGTSALHAAIYAGNVDITEILIEYGANMEAIDNDGNTPFLIAASFGDTLIMDILYKYGVDIYSKNNLNHDALALAIAFNHKEAVTYLLHIGGKWKEAPSTEINPYMVAMKYGRKDIVEILNHENIPGSVKHSLDMAALSVYTRSTKHNFYSGFSLSVREPYLDAGFTIGVNTKFWQTRILVKKGQDLYYQYVDKSSMVFAGLFKDFTLRDKLNNNRLLFSTSLSAGYTFGNKFKGTDISPEKKLYIIPCIAIKRTTKPLTFFIGLDYLNLDYYKTGSLWTTIGFSGNFYFNNMQIKQKRIKWN